MQDLRARRRTATLPPAPPAGAEDPRIRVTRAHLLALEGPARALTFLPRQPARSVLNGRHASRLRGRGLNFEELRDYLPSDDVRAIDWKVTARTGQPHIRVFTEERDRPALIVTDQRMSMFFGSRLNMKSVTAAEAAALTGFAILAQGDRVGGLIFGDAHMAEIRPQRSRAALHRVLTALADAQSLLSAEAPAVEPVALSKVLRAVLRIAPRNHLIVFLSDFDGIDTEAERLMATLSRKNDVLLAPVTDPTAEEIPADLRLIVSDGALQAEIDTGADDQRRALSDFARGRIATVLDWQRRFGMPVLPLSAGAQTLPQLRRLLGLAPR